MTDPKEKIYQFMMEKFQADAWSILHMTVGDSPIENLLFIAIGAILGVEDISMRRCGGQFGLPQERLNKCPEASFCYEAQAQIEGYRVDFAFHKRGEEGDGLRSLVVECDGHDFHERTKQQAIADRSRDRRLQELGYTVYRFTGSEIYTDPIKCAQQVITWVGWDDES